MNAKEMKKVIEEKVIDAQRAFRVELELHGPDGHDTRNLAHASCALGDLYEDLFGRDEYVKLIEKHFPETDED